MGTFTSALSALGLPFSVATDGLQAWAALSRKTVGLQIVNQIKAPLSMSEYVFMVRNDDEFVKTPILINARGVPPEVRGVIELIGYTHMLNDEMPESKIREAIEKMYGRSNIVAGMFCSSPFVEHRMKSIFAGTNLFLKLSSNSKDFLRRLETSNPELLLIDLRVKDDVINTVLKVIADDPEWSKIPRLTVGPATHALIKDANAMGCPTNIDETNSDAEVRKLVQTSCSKPFLELPLPGLKPVPPPNIQAA